MSEDGDYVHAYLESDSDSEKDIGNEETPLSSSISDDSNSNYDSDLQSFGLRGALRKGKWTVEEETYANKIIQYFNQGSLAIASGTTLRSYLSEKLNWYEYCFLF